MIINQNTKISAIIKENPDVIEAIVSINKHFEKLRNPILRKILASRVSIADAAKIGGTTIQIIFEKLTPLGFFCEEDNSKNIEKENPVPEFFKTLTKKYLEELDVRKDLDTGKDPFNKIMDVLAQMPDKYTLKIINTFEPLPLIHLLQKKGYSSYTVIKESNVVYTYLKYTGEKHMPPQEDNLSVLQKGNSEETDKLLKQYKDKIKIIDVRNLEMPLPMTTILDALKALPSDTLLYVNHKKIPQYLLPEIQEQGYKWVINEVKEGDVQILIYR